MNLLPREKITIGLCFLGLPLLLIGIGISLSHAFPRKSGPIVSIGAWRDLNGAGVFPVEIAPWMIGGAIILLTTAYYTRER